MDRCPHHRNHHHTWHRGAVTAEWLRNERAWRQICAFQSCQGSAGVLRETYTGLELFNGNLVACQEKIFAPNEEIV